jgi:hypothetical protein
MIENRIGRSPVLYLANACGFSEYPKVQEGVAVQVRTTTTIVTFLSPIRLAGLANTLPAGSYLVETDELLMPDPASPARHAATFLRLPQPRGPSSRRHSLLIDPQDLEAALQTDRTRAEARLHRAKLAPRTGMNDENA